VQWRPWQGQQQHHSLHWQQWQQQWQQQRQQQQQQLQAKEDQATEQKVPLLQQLLNRDRGKPLHDSSVDGSVRGGQRFASQLSLPQLPDMSSSTSSPSSPMYPPPAGLAHSYSSGCLTPIHHFHSPAVSPQGSHSVFAPKGAPHWNSMPQLQFFPPALRMGSPTHPVPPHGFSGPSSPASPYCGDLSLPLPSPGGSSNGTEHPHLAPHTSWQGPIRWPHHKPGSNGNSHGAKHTDAPGAGAAPPSYPTSTAVYCSSASMRRPTSPVSASVPLGRPAFPSALHPADLPRSADPLPAAATTTLPPPPAAMVSPSPSPCTDPLPLISAHSAAATTSAPTTPGASGHVHAAPATLGQPAAAPCAPLGPTHSSPFASATETAAAAAAGLQPTASPPAPVGGVGPAFAVASPNPSCPPAPPSKAEAPRAQHKKSHTLALGGVPTPGGKTRTLSHDQPHGGWGSNVFNRWGIKRLRRSSERRASSKFAQLPSSREVLKHHLTVEVEPGDLTLLGPYQAILQMRMRQKDGPGKTRPLMCIEHETATVLNNLAVLLRWNQGATEAEALLNQALRLLDPPPLANAGHGRTFARASVEFKLTKAGNPNSAGQEQAGTPLVSPNASKANMSHLDRPSFPEGSMAADGRGGWAGSSHVSDGLAGATRNSTAAGLLPMTIDPRIAHLKAMVLSNLGGLLGSQGRYQEAMTSYREAMRMCEGFNRPVDEMIIATNLICVYRRLNLMQPALRLAQASVEPVLGVTFGVHSRRTRNQAQSQSNKEPGPAHWGYDPTNPYNHPFGKGYGPHPGNSSTAGGGHWEGTDPMADYKTQLLEALATCVADDGAASLYMWAGQQLAKRELVAARKAKEQQQQQHERSQLPSTEGHELLLPETLFLLQIPGVHLQCIHMLRWLLVVPAEEHLGCAGPDPNAGLKSAPLSKSPTGRWAEADITGSNQLSSLIERLSGRPRTSAPHKLPSQRL